MLRKLLTPLLLAGLLPLAGCCCKDNCQSNQSCPNSACYDSHSYGQNGPTGPYTDAADGPAKTGVTGDAPPVPAPAGDTPPAIEEAPSPKPAVPVQPAPAGLKTPDAAASATIDKTL